MLATMTSRQVSEWQAYERLSGPLGGARGDLSAAIIASTIANVNRGKGQPPYKPSRFIPDWDPKPQSPEHMKMIVRAMNKAFGGKEVGSGANSG